MFVFSQSGAGCLIKVAGGSVSGDLQVAACSWVPHDAFPLSHAVRNLCGMKSLSLVTLFNTASAKVLPPSTVAPERSTSTSPQPWGVPQLLSVQSAQYMVPTRAIKAILEMSLTCVLRAPLSFLSSGEASAASSNFLTFSFLLRSGLQLTPLGNAQVWYRPLNQDKTVPISAERCYAFWALQGS